VVVLRALQLGDLLCTVPAFRALRAALPEAEISLVGLPWAAEFVARFGAYLDRFIEFPGYPGLPEREPQIERIEPFLAALQRERYDLAIQMHGSGTVTNPLLLRFGAQRIAGYYRPSDTCPDPATFLPFPEHEHEVRCHLRLLEFLGAPACGEEIEFPLTPEDYVQLAALPQTAALQPGEYVCVHPGARWPSRRWPVERFAAVADALAGQGLRVVLTGSEGERELTAAVAAAMRAPALDLAGRTSLGALGALLGGARLLVCNDTGISHVAAGTRTPSVVVVLGSEPVRWAPLDLSLHRIATQPIACRPCSYRACPIGHPCALAVTPEQVLALARDLTPFPSPLGRDDPACRARAPYTAGHRTTNRAEPPGQWPVDSGTNTRRGPLSIPGRHQSLSDAGCEMQSDAGRRGAAP